MSEESPTKEEKESLARSQLPYKAEYCKTSRAKCKKCGEAMESGSLKLASMIKSRFHDGFDANFYHVVCFFQIKRPTSVTEIGHFDTLKYDDQKLLEKAVETNGLSVLGTNVAVEEVSSKSKKKVKEEKSKSPAKKREKKDDSTGVLVNYDDFLVEYAKSSRAKCKLCDDKIEKASVRLGKLDYTAESRWQAGPLPRWYHLECFIKSQVELEFFGKVDKVKGFSELEEGDRAMLKKKILPLVPPNIGDISNKKIKTDDEASTSSQEEEKLLKKQSDRFFALREHVATMKRKDIEAMLESMQQKFNYKSTNTLVDMATDILLFGPLAECPKCNQPMTMELRGGSYICNKSFDSSPCSYETREPKRSQPEIPEEIMEKYGFFTSSYKFKSRKRIFSSKFVKAVEQKEVEVNKIVLEGAPLEGLSIGIITWGAIKTEKSKVQNKIVTLGAKLTTALDKSLFIILINEAELQKNSPKVEVAKALEIPFATEGFLFSIKTKEDVVPQLTKCLIGGWADDLETRFTEMSANKK